MSDWAATFLGTIALATLVMAVIQVGFIVYAVRMVRRMYEMTYRVERELAPALEHLNRVTHDAARMSSLAVTQAERVNLVFRDVAARVDATAGVLQHTLRVPAREAVALLRAARVVIGALRAGRSAPVRGNGRRADEDEQLFIG